MRLLTFYIFGLLLVYSCNSSTVTETDPQPAEEGTGHDSVKTQNNIASGEVIYVLPSEASIYEFETTNGKKVVLAKDQQNNYIVYRFGTDDKIEFEYPDKNKDSWKKFTYSSYLRGGGPDNAGMDLNYIVFKNDSFQYVIYDTYFSAKEEYKTGIKVTDLKTNKVTDIKGSTETKKGTLIDFRDNGLLEIGEELF